MLYSLHALVFPRPLELLNLELLHQVRDIGYDGIELVPIDFAPADLNRFRVLCEQARLRPLVGWSLEAAHHLADPTRAPDGLRQMRHLINVAACLGAPLLAGLNYAGCGALSGLPPTEAELACAAESVRSLAEFAAGRGIRLCLEPATREDSYLINTVAQGLAFCDRVGHPNTALLLDTFQMLREEDNIGQAIRSAGGQIGLVHVSESHRGTPGTGTVPWEEVGRALRDVGYDGWLSVEAFFDPHSPVAARAKVWRQLEKDPLTLARRAMTLMRTVLS